MRPRIDFNADAGEGFGAWKLGDDEAVLRQVSSANLACGLHAGDFSVMQRTVRLCKELGVGVGAQPGFPDLQGFGRRVLRMEPAELEACVLYQIGALYAFCRGDGVPLRHVKPHGALYNAAAVDPTVARAIARAVARFSRDLPLVGLAGSAAFTGAAADAGVPFVPEAFGDRRYDPDGTLQSRAVAGSVLTDPSEVADQVTRIVRDGSVAAAGGSAVPVAAASICFHGDTPGAPALIAAARAALASLGVSIASPDAPAS